jgi:hypothetical protein
MRSTFACDYCGAAVQRQPSGTTFAHIYCSRKCHSDAQRMPRLPFNEAVQSMPDAARARFWARVDRSAGGATCWPWTGGRGGSAYGRMSLNGVYFMAHRIAFGITYGSVPDDLQVCHRCDNPLCCNPSHLFLGTNEDNRRDMIAKRRHNIGERNGASKLTWKLVRQIRSLRAAGYKLQAIADKIGVVDRATVGRVVREKIWNE